MSALAEAVRRLEAHVASLTEELAARRREVAELHAVVGMVTRALPAPGADPDWVQQPGAADGYTRPRTSNGAAPMVWERRRWWHRLLWG